MYRRQLTSRPCMNYKCPHNLFWEGLKLNAKELQITSKALAIRNCCCLINEPWTAEEIEGAWGLRLAEILRCEATAWKKISKVNGSAQLT